MHTTLCVAASAGAMRCQQACVCGKPCSSTTGGPSPRLRAKMRPPSVSIHSLPPFWQAVSHLNPFFYMIDGFRYGFFGQSDVNPVLSLAIVGSFLIGLALFSIRMLRSGYRLRH